MNTKKTTITRKQKTITKSVKPEQVAQANPVTHRIQTQAGWKRGQLMLRAQKKR